MGNPVIDILLEKFKEKYEPELERHQTLLSYSSNQNARETRIADKTLGRCFLQALSEELPDDASISVYGSELPEQFDGMKNVIRFETTKKKTSRMHALEVKIHSQGIHFVMDIGGVDGIKVQHESHDGGHREQQSALTTAIEDSEKTVVNKSALFSAAAAASASSKPQSFMIHCLPGIEYTIKIGPLSVDYSTRGQGTPEATSEFCEKIYSRVNALLNEAMAQFPEDLSKPNPGYFEIEKGSFVRLLQQAQAKLEPSQQQTAGDACGDDTDRTLSDDNTATAGSLGTEEQSSAASFAITGRLTRGRR